MVFTQVVENHIRAICSRGHSNRLFLLCGPRVGGLTKPTEQLIRDGHVVVLRCDAMEYDSLSESSRSLIPGSAFARGMQLASQICHLFKEQSLTPESTVIHWHNPTLGKNVAAPAAIQYLAKQQWRLLLQIHDFAEDNRPENMLQLIRATGAKSRPSLDQYLYCVAPTIHYATLTGGDANALERIGIPRSKVSCLPNSVQMTDTDTDVSESRRKVYSALNLNCDTRLGLYPVRGIRRKNVGELLLLSRLLPQRYHAAITLCPETEIERLSYVRWREAASYLAPRVHFDVGMLDSFEFVDLLQASHCVISTSVAEGFGMAMLEPWLLRRGVMARDLPGVTSDFVESGIHLPAQYDAMPIPGDPAWLATVRDEYREAFMESWMSVPETFQPTYNQPEIVDEAAVDFALLTSERQRDTLNRMASDQGFEREVRDQCKAVLAHIDHVDDPDVIDRNERIIRKTYGQEQQAKDLIQIYDSILELPITGHANLDCESSSSNVNAIDIVNEIRPFFPCRTERLDR